MRKGWIVIGLLENRMEMGEDCVGKSVGGIWDVWLMYICFRHIS